VVLVLVLVLVVMGVLVLLVGVLVGGILLPVLLVMVLGVVHLRGLVLVLPRVRMPLHVWIRVRLLRVMRLLRMMRLSLPVRVVSGRGVVPRLHVIRRGRPGGLEHGHVSIRIGALRPPSHLRLHLRLRLAPRSLRLRLERGPAR
jgi:hypothetical protein